MENIRFDHVALLVRNLEDAIADYREILSVLTPENSTEIVRHAGVEGKYEFSSATFVSRNGQAVIQLIESKHPKDMERLADKGECVHHIEFCSNNVKHTHNRLRSANIPLTSEKTRKSDVIPWQESTTISPKKSHGVLVKVATQYKVEDGNWIPELS